MIKYKTKNTSGLSNSREYIVVHHTATKEGTAQGVINWFVNGDRASCHYLVDENGQIYSFNTEKDVLWHAGASSRWNRKDMNKYSIGIEVIWPLSGKEQFTDAQRKSVAYLIKDISMRNNIKPENILRHKDVSPWRKVDIYDTFWNWKYNSRIDFVKSIFIVDDAKMSKVKEYMKKWSDIWSIWDEDEKKMLKSMNDFWRSKWY